MYVKLFASIYQGTLRGNPHGLLVFTNLLAHADQDGIVDITPKVISDEVGLTIEEVKAALVMLESPDDESRTPDEEGKRIVRMDAHRSWGWQIVNYLKYRGIRDPSDRREQNRLAQARRRDKKKAADSQQESACVSKSQHVSARSAHIEADTDTDTDTENTRASDISSLIVNAGEEKLKVDLENTDENVDFAGKPPKGSRRPIEAGVAFHDPLHDFSPDVAANARQCCVEYYAKRFGSLPNVHNENFHRDVRDIASAFEAFPEGHERFSKYLADKLPKGHTRSMKVFQVLKYLGLDPGDRVSSSGKLKEQDEYARLMEIVKKGKRS